MRYYKIIVLVLLFLTGVLIAAIESGPGQRWMQKKLREALADSGIHVEAEQFSGQLPQTMDLKNARIQCDGVSLRIKHLHLELSLFPLLHKEVSIENLTAEGVQLEQIPDRPGKREGKLPFALTVHSFQIKDFEWPSQPAVSLEGALTIERNGHGSVEVEVEGTHLSVKGTFDQFSGKAYGRYEDFSFATRFLKKQGEPLALLDTVVSRRGVRVEGEVWLDLPKRFAKADLHLQANVGKEPLTSSGSIQGYWNDTSFDGFVRATGQFLQESWTLNSPLSANRSKGIGLWKLQLQSPLFEGEGQLFWKEGNLSGHLDAELDLSLFSDYSVSGRLSSTLDFNEEISGSAILKNLRFDSLHVGEVSLQGSTDQSLDIQIQNGKWKQFNLDTAALKAVKKEENWAWAFSFTAPLTAGQMQGYWRPNQLLLEEGSGQYLGVPIRTETPAFITWSDQTILWNPFTLQVGEKGNLFFSLDKSVEKTEIQLNLQSFPLALFSSSAKGDLDFRAAFEEKKGTTSGQLQASISNAEVLVEGDEYRRATAQLEARLENTDLLLQSNLEVHDSSLVSLDLKLPVHLQIWPFQGKIYPDGPASAELLINGHVEEILDFFHWGMHRFAAHADCKMSMTGSLANPQLEGSCMLTNGHYENYFTGTELTNLTAEIRGEGDRLVLKTLHAKDAKKKGNFTASGDLRVSLPDHFPFHFAVDFTRMNVVQIDLMNAEAEGHLLIDGDLRSALAKGRIEIIESEITIPDKIPRSYPDLPVVYKNAKRPPANPAEPQAPYPLHLEIAIDAPEGVFIDGRGLHSEWHGQFNVAGTFANPSAQGKLELINGEFSFVGRHFKLTEGALSLKGKAYELPTINIAGTTSEKGISITAHLAGPLNKPQITFHSSPPLPMSGILAYLLFGQDLSEVSGIQALQLAGTVATFAGEGPDILEITRKSLGVDRLQIVMTPSGTEGEETIALQVGKIVFPGFLVSIKQGADDSSPNIAIEVDLTHGFTFEAESQQQPEQGKFSLLWNLNY